MTPFRRHTQLITDTERAARILVVDDERSNLDLLLRILARAGFADIAAVGEARDILPTLCSYNPDIVLLDLHLPGVNGLDLIADIGAVAGRNNFLPVVVLTGDTSVGTRDAALSAGAKDYLTKPYDSTEVVLRVRNLIATRMLHVELQRQHSLLHERFAERTEELEEAKVEILERLARAADFRDESTYAHTTRVGELSARIARRLGMSDTEVEQIRIAARLHDIGKIGVSDSILLKPGPLGPAEFMAQERHTIIGANILSGSRFPTMRLAESIALTHHEAWDGTGYPNGLAGDEIPIAGRIVAVADVFDALTHARPYKAAWSVDAGLAEISAQSGYKFDPRVVQVFVAMLRDETSAVDLETDADLPARGIDREAQRLRLVRDVFRSGTSG